MEGVVDDFPHRPFCSSRCKTIDLGRWLDESYRISTPIADHEASDEAAPASDEAATEELLRRLRSGG